MATIGARGRHDASLENLDEDLATGMVFDRFDSQDCAAALRRATARHFHWAAAASRYRASYEELATPSGPA